MRAITACVLVSALIWTQAQATGKTRQGKELVLAIKKAARDMFPAGLEGSDKGRAAIKAALLEFLGAPGYIIPTVHGAEKRLGGKTTQTIGAGPAHRLISERHWGRYPDRNVFAHTIHKPGRKETFFVKNRRAFKYSH